MRTCALLRFVAALALVHVLAFSARAAGSACAQDEKSGCPAAGDASFKPSLESLKQYKCPQWFRDAKFGIWAHWGPQAVPMVGDWYARRMYIEGDADYVHHLKTYGHPSQAGYKDIIPLWKAEKWNPDRLMALYKKAGARYFVSMGVHHDNFDLWNSRFHRWNAVKMGPHRDVVGTWQKAAKKQGLRFGVSEHLGASFTWFQPSHGADKTGPKAGVPYDGANPRYDDLYHPPAAPDDKDWYSKSAEWQQEWLQRITDLIDHYNLDLLYTDGGVPFGNEVGLNMISHLYNNNRQCRGNLQVVYTCKQKSEGRWVEDLERGVMPGINPNPWQTDTSIGDWYYNKNWKFRPVSWVIHMLVDIVSKNGNLLLNVVQRPDGSLDAEVEQMLRQLAAWNAVNGEAIFGTRPWRIYGEGAVQAAGGNFKEDFAYSNKDIRFTTKGHTLYAIAMGWPDDGRLVVRSLGKSSPVAEGEIQEVRLLGHDGKLPWSQSDEGLIVTLPEKKPCEYAFALKITGQKLVP
jgi:alpha-L-fucosidase